MTIRPGLESDIPAIIELLRLSLGEHLMPKTEAFWRWKHLENPFGMSDILLAFEKGALVGLRVFMKWEWSMNAATFKAVRAVDTATRPDFQGKGIFSTLTNTLVEDCKRREVDFVFNTPNAKSKPGYLKLGWHEVGRLRMNFRPVLFRRSQSGAFLEEFGWNADWSRNFPFHQQPDRLTTRTSPEYLDWRYGRNPNVRYHLAVEQTDRPRYAIIFRLKPHRVGLEFRICDAYRMGGDFVAPMRSHLREAIRKSGASLVSWTSGQMPGAVLPAIPIGPIVTLLPLTPRSNSVSFKTWSPTVGDLEVF